MKTTATQTLRDTNRGSMSVATTTYHPSQVSSNLLLMHLEASAKSSKKSIGV